MFIFFVFLTGVYWRRRTHRIDCLRISRYVIDILGTSLGQKYFIYTWQGEGGFVSVWGVRKGESERWMEGWREGL